jgi:3,4-dihydroxy-9,10-secoandrosta-1,3,5(10)-triene-9,17-dione 4,5-dioxygenase
MAASLSYLVLETPDPDAWDRFLQQTVGMAAGERNGDGESRYRMDDHDWRIAIRTGAAERVAALGIEYESDTALDACLGRLHDGGVETIDDLALAGARGVLRLNRATDPGGVPVELIVGRRLAYAPFRSPAGVSGFVTGDGGGMGLGHAVLATKDIEASRRFWIEGMGFALTDTMHFPLIPGQPPKPLYFLHARNPRHHSIAVLDLPMPALLVHFMVEVLDIDDVGRFIDRCDRDGVVVATRLGRHSNDRMLSVYVVTPGGYMMEFGCDGLQIDWRNWIPTTSLVPDLWGHRMTAAPKGMPDI